jgi:hypothetical protein
MQRRPRYSNKRTEVYGHRYYESATWPTGAKATVREFDCRPETALHPDPDKGELAPRRAGRLRVRREPRGRGYV